MLDAELREQGLSPIKLSQDKANTLHIRLVSPDIQGVGFLPIWAIVALIPAGIISWRAFTMEPPDLIKLIVPIAGIAIAGYFLWKAVGTTAK